MCTGYNGTLFAYGQTGSGKTYTIGEIAKLGTQHEGVAHRMIRYLYNNAANKDVAQFKVSVQYVQVYLEQAYDLLTESAGRDKNAKLQLRESKEHGVYIEGASTIPAPDADTCLGLLERASRNLKFAATQMNRNSSRSHAVCRLLVEVKHVSSTGTPPSAMAQPKVPSDPLTARADEMLREQGGQTRPDAATKDIKAWRRRSVDLITKQARFTRPPFPHALCRRLGLPLPPPAARSRLVTSLSTAGSPHRRLIRWRGPPSSRRPPRQRSRCATSPARKTSGAPAPRASRFPRPRRSTLPSSRSATSSQR